MREVHDHYFHLAKKEGYVSRAAYKLLEIDDRKRILRRGDRVLDCGAAPGSWMQVAAQRVGPTGVVVGIDLLPINLPPHKLKSPQGHVLTAQGDFTTTLPDKLLALAGKPRHKFDVVLSDMAPKTTGDPFSDHHQSVRLCHALLDACAALLKPGGNLVMKVFEGEAYPELLKRIAGLFDVVKGFKPKASRSESAEMFIVATAFKPSGITMNELESPPVPPTKRAEGW